MFHAVKDDGSIFAATNHDVYGATVQRSADGGKTWERSEGLALPEDHELTLEKTWHVEPGADGVCGSAVRRASSSLGGPRGDLGAGVEPDRPSDAGALEPGRRRHVRPFDPDRPNRLADHVRRDLGRRRLPQRGWGRGGTPANKGTAADFMPDDPFPEVGQCVHKVLVHPTKTERLWQQNHCGVYRTDDKGESWERLEDNGLPSSFGFPIAIYDRSRTWPS